MRCWPCATTSQRRGGRLPGARPHHRRRRSRRHRLIRRAFAARARDDGKASRRRDGDRRNPARRGRRHGPLSPKPQARFGPLWISTTPSLYSIASRSEAPRMEDEVRVPIASDVDLLTTSASELSWLRSTASRTRPDRAFATSPPCQSSRRGGGKRSGTGRSRTRGGRKRSADRRIDVRARFGRECLGKPGAQRRRGEAD